MKRILAITLTLVMLLAALTGCMASKNPSGKEGEQNPSGKRLPITMTIAETLPSCVAFEYKDEKPYCFYAYDTEGHLYRVLWDDFTGLNEKDVIIIDHNDDIKELDYVNPPGGWSPKYEVTAISVKKEINPEDYLVSHIQIKSGDNTIRPFGSLLWSKTDNGDGTFTELIVDIPDTQEIVNLYADVIPKLVLNESVSYMVQVNGSVEKVYLLIPNEDGYTKSETTFDALSNLENGTYYVAFNVLLSGNCDPDAPQNSYRYEDVFCLVVGEDDRPDASDMITYSAFDWPHYDTLQSLYDAATDIYEGTVSNVFFKIIDMRSGKAIDDKMPDDKAYLRLYTIYEIDVTASHKNAESNKMHVCVCTGLEGYKEAEQRNLMESAGIYNENTGIQVMREFKPLQIGHAYLFLTVDLGGTYNYIVNADQFAFNQNDAEKPETFCYSEIKTFVVNQKEANNDANSFIEFSFADEKAMFPEGTPGVKHNGFKNTTELPVHNDAETIERAKNECTIDWNDTKVYYDTTKDVWKVTFYTKGVPGGDQSVYLGENGITLMIVYGE